MYDTFTFKQVEIRFSNEDNGGQLCRKITDAFENQGVTNARLADTWDADGSHYLDLTIETDMDLVDHIVEIGDFFVYQEGKNIRIQAVIPEAWDFLHNAISILTNLTFRKKKNQMPAAAAA